MFDVAPSTLCPTATAVVALMTVTSFRFWLGSDTGIDPLFQLWPLFVLYMRVETPPPRSPTAMTVDPLKWTAFRWFPVGLAGAVQFAPPSVLRAMAPFLPTAVTIVDETKMRSNRFSFGSVPAVSLPHVAPLSVLRRMVAFPPCLRPTAMTVVALVFTAKRS